MTFTPNKVPAVEVATPEVSAGFDTVVEQIGLTVTRFEQAVTVLEQCNDKLYGADPKAEQTPQQGTVAPHSILNGLRELLYRVSSVADRAELEIRRLEEGL